MFEVECDRSHTHKQVGRQEEQQIETNQNKPRAHMNEAHKHTIININK